MRPQALSPSEIGEKLVTAKGWRLVNNAISKEFKFSNFIEAFAFMTKVAFEAEKLNHHPEWKNVYNTVSINLSTHDAKGITELDFKLAEKIDKYATNGL